MSDERPGDEDSPKTTSEEASEAIADEEPSDPTPSESLLSPIDISRLVDLPGLSWDIQRAIRPILQGVVADLGEVKIVNPISDEAMARIRELTTPRIEILDLGRFI